MKKIYYLSTCDTNKRILKELNLPKDFIKQDLKTNPVSEKELEELYQFSKSYESLINKRARLYNDRCLKNQVIKEADYKKLLLEHYTFLKRPILINEKKIFIGNNKDVVAAAKHSLF
ncbi:hypothetical protein OAN97_00115 [Flavobacteriaceae bacterium]|jgi:arsenate reductase|nr:hypothetical protein [Flavobacteriaceae bacterium]MDB9993219.1 hypothetical protein [Flavobacteriaceae bacterium]MDC0538875.1 hypothetical protein [Flavobacteriaceae bacterium]|tara:strand:+ start:1235 stop:1585 length:351 start_codon:yes stop_codon:yes gene_type:complete